MTDSFSRERAIAFILDDDPDMRELLIDIADLAGCEAVAAANVDEFFDRFTPERAGCIVLDLALPGASGLEVLKRLRESGVTHPVIIVSGSVDVPAAGCAYKQGAIDVIQKPFRSTDMVELIRKAASVGTRARRDGEGRALYLKRVESLAPTERKVFRSLLDGWTSRKIAAEYAITRDEVRAVRRCIKTKLMAHALADLIETATLNLSEADRERLS